MTDEKDEVHELWIHELETAELTTIGEDVAESMVKEMTETGVGEVVADVSIEPEKGRQISGSGSEMEARVMENSGSSVSWPGVCASRIRSAP